MYLSGFLIHFYVINEENNSLFGYKNEKNDIIFNAFEKK